MSREPGAALTITAASPSPVWSDSRLVAACLNGNQDAWSVLIRKYKNLIYSVPLKYRAPAQDAADIFQAVCVDLFLELPKLRKIQSLRSWLITVAIHKSYQWKQKQARWSDQEPEDVEREAVESFASRPIRPEEQQLVEEAEREQIVRDALAQLPERCQEMIRLLYYEHPPLPYHVIASRLGLATGSIGFIRGRCLKRLYKILKDMRFR